MPENNKRVMTEARKKANAKYDSKAYDKIIVRVETGKREEIKAHAEQYQDEVGTIGTAGYTPKGSLNGFIVRAIDEKMERDKSLNFIDETKTTPDTPEATTSKSANVQPEQQPIQPAEQAKLSIIDNNDFRPQANDDSDSDFTQLHGFTREDIQKSNEAAERWKAKQANKEKEKRDRKKMQMNAINQTGDTKEGD